VRDVTARDDFLFGHSSRDVRCALLYFFVSGEYDDASSAIRMDRWRFVAVDYTLWMVGEQQRESASGPFAEKRTFRCLLLLVLQFAVFLSALLFHLWNHRVDETTVGTFAGRLFLMQKACFVNCFVSGVVLVRWYLGIKNKLYRLSHSTNVKYRRKNGNP